MSAVAAKVD